jgi:hypothetical protein
LSVVAVAVEVLLVILFQDQEVAVVAVEFSGKLSL